MSSPDTNLDRQVSRHKPVLVGFGIIVLIVAVLSLWTGTWSTEDDAAPEITQSAGS